MGRPRKLDALVTNISARIRTDQDEWLRNRADTQFEGELSRTLRWAIDQCQVFEFLLRQDDPGQALDEMLHPEKYEPAHPEEEVIEAEREFEAWRRAEAIKRARRKTREGAKKP
jgi:hypothetical protein